MRALLLAVVAAACAPQPSVKPTRPPGWPAAADVLRIVQRGELVELGDHAVLGKVTVFDFFAVWCKPCTKVDAHLRGVAALRTDVAVRQLDVVDWETPLARHYLAEISGLPYVVVYDPRGRYVGAVAGLDLPGLDRLIAGATP